MTKEERNKLIDKWSPFMEGLSKSKSKRYKFARIYESTIMNNEKKNYKLLLSLEYQIFKKSINIRLSSKKNKLIVYDVHSYEQIDLYENNRMLPTAVVAYNAAISTQVVNDMKNETIPKISFMKIESKGLTDSIKIYY